MLLGCLPAMSDDRQTAGGVFVYKYLLKINSSFTCNNYYKTNH